MTGHVSLGKLITKSALLRIALLWFPWSPDQWGSRWTQQKAVSQYLNQTLFVKLLVLARLVTGVCVSALESCDSSFSFLAYCIPRVFVCLFSWLLIFSLKQWKPLSGWKGIIHSVHNEAPLRVFICSRINKAGIFACDGSLLSSHRCCALLSRGGCSRGKLATLGFFSQLTSREMPKVGSRSVWPS